LVYVPVAIAVPSVLAGFMEAPVDSLLTYTHEVSI
jgi:hypothetical protein